MPFSIVSVLLFIIILLVLELVCFLSIFIPLLEHVSSFPIAGRIEVLRLLIVIQILLRVIAILMRALIGLTLLMRGLTFGSVVVNLISIVVIIIVFFFTSFLFAIEVFVMLFLLLRFFDCS